MRHNRSNTSQRPNTFKLLLRSNTHLLNMQSSHRLKRIQA